MIKDVIIVILAGILVSVFLYNSPRTEGRWYDCGMAEWHPDIPNEVKDECRRRALEHWKNNNDKSSTNYQKSI
jgi:hypothetical protein